MKSLLNIREGKIRQNWFSLAYHRFGVHVTAAEMGAIKHDNVTKFPECMLSKNIVLPEESLE